LSNSRPIILDPLTGRSRTSSAISSSIDPNGPIDLAGKLNQFVPQIDNLVCLEPRIDRSTRRIALFRAESIPPIGTENRSSFSEPESEIKVLVLNDILSENAISELMTNSLRYLTASMRPVDGLSWLGTVNPNWKPTRLNKATTANGIMRPARVPSTKWGAAVDMCAKLTSMILTPAEAIV
jgi:hypothetical protein